MSMNYVLGNCEDFRNEKGALQCLVEARGHILVMSPKGHCELAGQGIEYDWGKMKQNFRRKNKYKHFHGLILDSMSRATLPLSTSRKFARTSLVGEKTTHVCASFSSDPRGFSPNQGHCVTQCSV